MALPQVNVFPISGPAIFHTGSFPPNSMAEGSVSLYGLTVKSPDASGIDLPSVTGSIGLLAVHTDENAGEGAFLRAGDEINLSAVTAHLNDSIGVDAISTNAEALLIDVSANGNKADGVTVVAKGSVLVFTADFSDLSGLPLQDFSGSTFNGNKGDGLRASSSDGSVVVARSFLLLNGTGSFVEANDNTGRGMDFGSADGVTLVGVRADRNASGITAVSDDDILVIGVSANSNTTGGGVKATSSSDGSNFIFGIGVLVLSSTASGNAGAGFELTDTMGNVAVLGSAAVMNGIDGVRLTALAGDTSSVEGNILCDNTASGLRLLSATSVNGEGNWWGSATGPTHPGNPGGTGNAVIDGSNGGAGTVDYLPFIDTVTSLAPAATAIHQTTSVHFQFSGGGGTVFLGVPESFAFIFPAGVILPPDPPFTLTTDNGVLIDEDESAATIHSAINEPEGVLAVRLKAAQLGTATVTLDGPCGLDSLVTLQIGRLSTAPVLSLIALASLAALLALAGARRVSSR